jgi:hypothetical protein
MSDYVLVQLQQSGHLLQPSSTAYQVREQQSLSRLQCLMARTYLQEYDLLFRYVSRWLMGRGYELTGKQPHKVMSRVCEQFMSHPQVREVIKCRHALKYEGSTPTSQAISTLSKLMQLLSSAH